MIKPGTLCMIRGVPSHRIGSDLNGNIVVVGGIKTAEESIYWIQPELVDRRGRLFTGCREQWLYPFEDFDPQHTTTKTLETA
jgi:hypothetical protein